MTNRIIITLHVCLLIAVMLGCAKPPSANSEGQPAPDHLAPPVAPPKPEAQPLVEARPPATVDEARAKLAFVYEDVVKIDGSRTPGFITGDFNGDSSADIAITVTPVKDKLADINSEYANWMLCDLKTAPAIDPLAKIHQAALKVRPVIGADDNVLLAIIHGYGPEGWRDPEARQTYLIKSLVGRNIETIMKRDLQKSVKGEKQLPVIRGDVISQKIAGQSGFIYYTGARYAWYEKQK